MTVAEMIEHLKTLPQDAICGYSDPCFGGIEMEVEKSNIYYDEQKNRMPPQPYVHIGEYGECHLD